MKRFFYLLVACGSFHFAATSVQAQDDVSVESAPRERIVVSVDHMSVQTIASAIRELSKGSDVKALGIDESNKLVIDAPKTEIPAALGLIRELDRPSPTIEVSVLEIVVVPDFDSSLRSGGLQQTLKKVHELVEDEQAKIVDRMTLSVAHNTRGHVQSGIQAAVQVATQRAVGKASALKSYSMQDTGTVFSCRPRASERAILLDFEFEKSELVSREGDMPSSRVTSRAASNVRIPKDEAIVVGGRRQGSDQKPVQWYLILSASVSSE